MSTLSMKNGSDRSRLLHALARAVETQRPVTFELHVAGQDLDNCWRRYTGQIDGVSVLGGSDPAFQLTSHSGQCLLLPNPLGSYRGFEYVNPSVMSRPPTPEIELAAEVAAVQETAEVAAASAAATAAEVEIVQQQQAQQQHILVQHQQQQNVTDDRLESIATFIRQLQTARQEDALALAKREKVIDSELRSLKESLVSASTSATRELRELRDSMARQSVSAASSAARSSASPIPAAPTAALGTATNPIPVSSVSSGSSGFVLGPNAKPSASVTSISTNDHLPSVTSVTSVTSATSVTSVASSVSERAMLALAKRDEDERPHWSSHSPGHEDIFSPEELAALLLFPPFLLVKKESSFITTKRALQCAAAFAVDNAASTGQHVRKLFSAELKRLDASLSIDHANELWCAISDHLTTALPPRSLLICSELWVAIDRIHYTALPRLRVARLATKPATSEEVSAWMRKDSRTPIPTVVAIANVAMKASGF